MQTFRVWLYTLVAGFVSGASTALLSILAMPDVFNATAPGLSHIWKVSLIGGLIPTLTFLKQSPLPSLTVTATRTKTTTITKVEDPPRRSD